MMTKKAPITIPEKYLDYNNHFSKKLAAVLIKHTKINIHAINLKKDKQSPYRPIYSLRLVELEILKTYIKTNLANNFIQPSKFPASALILFNQKLDRNFQFCVNYQDLNNFTIKNQHSFPLIEKFLN